MSTYSHKSSVLLNALRKYSIPDVIIGGDKDCKHEFETVEYLHPTRGNRGQANDPKFAIRKDSQPTNNKADICIHCNAWKGQYGLEPTPDCGQPFMKLRKDLTSEEKEYVLSELKKYGTI